jgi:lipoyl-dependent peroxiredoxin
MSVDVKYRTSATATGGRDGQARTTDGSLNIKLAMPRELGGAGGPGATRGNVDVGLTLDL